jgi:3-dehydroquinate dehydratase/shikimate dehydrogenase
VVNPLICESLADTSLETLIARAAGARAADVVELRLDAVAGAELTRNDVKSIVAAAAVPAIATCRPRWQGGGFAGSEDRRREILEWALTAGAWRADVELAADWCETWLAEHRDRTVLSQHWVEPMPADLDAVTGRLAGLRPSICKLVAPALAPSDALPLLAAGRRLREAGLAAATFCTGASGRASRLLDLASGGVLTYARQSGEGADGGTAPGQWPVPWLRDELEVGSWRVGADRYGLIGAPIEHSLSPAIFNAAFAAEGSGAGYVPVAAADFESALRLAEAGGLSGVSVTMPFKVAATQAGVAHSLAGRAGAANTLVRRAGEWHAYNTDGPAVVGALEDQLPLAGARVLVLGAGGAARAAALSLVEAGAAVCVSARKDGRAEALAAAARCSSVPWREAPATEFDAIVNATPIGMLATDPAPISTDRLHGSEIVMDMIYRPHETTLLRQARARGCRTIPGIEMFLRQAAEQYLLWTGQAPPPGVMRRSAMQRLERSTQE